MLLKLMRKILSEAQGCAVAMKESLEMYQHETGRSSAMPFGEDQQLDGEVKGDASQC